MTLPLFHVHGNGFSFRDLTEQQGLEVVCWLSHLWTHTVDELPGGTGEAIYE